MKAIDLFAGFGGLTLGAEQAGVSVVWAANHWPRSVETHSLNHPNTQHECQDLRQADWTKLPRFDLLLAAPACQGHSEASQPRRRSYHDAMRATAWAVIDCAEVTQPRGILVENVPAFRRWQLYDLWRAALVRLGFVVEERIVMATNHGVPQLRERLFVFATRRRASFDLPRSAHAPAFGPCIDWDAGEWRDVSTAQPGARARIARAQANHGPRCLTQHVTGHPGVPLDEPIRTITTKDQWAIVDGDRYRPITVRETGRGMSFPDDYRLPPGITRREAIIGFGNAVAPKVARDLVGQLAEAA